MSAHTEIIGLEICDLTGEAVTWVAHSRAAAVARIYDRIQARAAEGRLAEVRYFKDPIEGLEYLGTAQVHLIAFDAPHAIAYIERKGAHHWTLYETLRDHGLIHPPFIVSWYDLPKAERVKRYWVSHASAEVWNSLEADAMAEHKVKAGAHDVRIEAFTMRGDLIQARPPPALTA